MKDLIASAWYAAKFLLFVVGATVLWGILLNEAWEQFGVTALYVGIVLTAWAFLTCVDYIYRR